MAASRTPVCFGQVRAWSNASQIEVPRSISLGSIDELRSNSFISARHRVFSLPNIAYQESLVRTSSLLAPKRSSRVVGVCDIDHLTNLKQLRKEPMFVDLQSGHQVNFVFPPSSIANTPSASPRHSTASRTTSFRDKESAVLLVRSSSITNRVERSFGKSKVPLFVPSQILKPCITPSSVGPKSSRSGDGILRFGDPEQDKPANGEERPSGETLSAASDWSTTVQFEPHREDIFCAQDEIGPEPRNPGLQLEQQLGTHQSDSVTGGLQPVGMSNVDGIHDAEATRGMLERHISLRRRILQTCSAYLHRLRRHLRGTSDGMDLSRFHDR